jgi:hypothetical protein
MNYKNLVNFVSLEVENYKTRESNEANAKSTELNI